MQVVIQAVVPVATGIVQLSLKPEAKDRPITVTPGAHIDLHLPNGLVRQYSLINSRASETLEVAVNLDPQSRGGSICVHKDLRQGDRIEIGQPRNHFPLNETAAHSVFIAGGIGVTPIFAMVERLAELGRSWMLFHCTRTPDRTPFAVELRDLATRSQGAVIHVHDGVPGIRPLDVTAVVQAASADTHFYCCGPKPLMTAFESATAGLPPHRVHVEYFSNDEAQHEGTEFELICARSGLAVKIPVGHSILETLETMGLTPLCSCREGICGTCETAVLEGTPDHRDLVLTPDERASNTSMMICVSRAKSRSLTLDI
ncbi:PDR/VanB family oxidoreductase [Mesorhizobium sp. NPDC059054]|uniref:PDR/VanB family oxidoreductase n=1 Tax=Mesorhizobium sp. NPDC059054 TaxID=3346711 RepID=UPI0036C29E6F